MANFADDFGWDEEKAEIYDHFLDDAADATLRDDEHLAELFDLALYGSLSGDAWDQAKDDLEMYLWEEYDLFFDDVFDWDEWREWYGTN